MALLHQSWVWCSYFIRTKVRLEDDALLRYQKALEEKEGILVEPSACAGFYGLMSLQNSSEYKKYIFENGIEEYMDNATHIVWATGGGLMPR